MNMEVKTLSWLWTSKSRRAVGGRDLMNAYLEKYIEIISSGHSIDSITDSQIENIS